MQYAVFLICKVQEKAIRQGGNEITLATVI